MKITNFNLKTKSVDIKSINLNFYNYGLYLISGKSGSGKSTIIKQLLFNKKIKVEFEDKNEENLFKKNKSDLIAYMDQMEYLSNLKAIDMVTKGNPNINLGELDFYLDLFKIPKSILKEKFSNLSGGEKTKLLIISSILKKCRYIFLDEPTNNLDNNSVEILKGILSEVSKMSSIIFISHDSRLNELNFISKYHIDNQSINSTDYRSSANAEKFNIYSKKKISLLNNVNLIFKITKNIQFLVTLFIFSFSMIFILLFSIFDYDSKKINKDHFPDNIVYSQGMDFFDEYDELLLKARNLDYEKNLNNYITLNSIFEMEKWEGIKDIYIRDIIYFYNLNYLIAERKLLDEINYFSVPLEILEISFTGFDLMLKFDKGDFPKNYSYGLATSKEVLKKHFNFKETDMYIGNKVTLPLDNKEYTITAFINLDIVLKSYNNEDNFGIYKYNKDTYKQFGDTLIDYQTKNGLKVGFLSDLYITVQDGYIDKITDNLYENYPVRPHLSTFSEDIIVKYKNTLVLQQILIFNSCLMCGIGIILFFILLRSLNYNNNILTDFGNYYLKPNKFRLIYMITSMLLVLFFLFLIFFCIVFYNIVPLFVFCSIFFIDFSIILISYLASFLLFYFKNKRY